MSQKVEGELLDIVSTGYKTKFPYQLTEQEILNEVRAVYNTSPKWCDVAIDYAWNHLRRMFMFFEAMYIDHKYLEFKGAWRRVRMERLAMKNPKETFTFTITDGVVVADSTLRSHVTTLLNQHPKSVKATDAARAVLDFAAKDIGIPYFKAFRDMPGCIHVFAKELSLFTKVEATPEIKGNAATPEPSPVARNINSPRTVDFAIATIRAKHMDAGYLDKMLAEIYSLMRKVRSIGNDEMNVTGEIISADLKARADFGLAKYSTHLSPDNKRNNLMDAYQELCDAYMYVSNEVYKLSMEEMAKTDKETT